MDKVNSASANQSARYRERQRAAGANGMLVHLPRETIDFIDGIKEREGLRNRSQVLQQLIEDWRAVKPGTP